MPGLGLTGVTKLLHLCARQGKLVLVLGLMAGLLLPSVAVKLQLYLPEMVSFLLFIAALRIAPDKILGTWPEVKAAFAVSLIYQVALPLTLLVIFKMIGFNGPIALAIVLAACAASIAGGSNLVLLTGNDPAPALRLLVVGTALLPLTVIPTFLLIPEFGSVQVVMIAASKLLLLIVVAAGAAMLVRKVFMPAPDDNTLASIDGISAIAMAIVVIGLMAAVGPALRADIDLALFTLICACAVNFGMQTIVWFTLTHSRFDHVRVSYTVIAGNRNIALFLASLPVAVTEPLLLFIGCYQIPMYLTPMFLKLFTSKIRSTWSLPPLALSVDACRIFDCLILNLVSKFKNCIWEDVTMKLTESQKKEFWENGVLMIEDAVTAEQLQSLRSQFSDWVEESRQHSSDYGETIDGRARFDLEPGHNAEKPALRRIQSPEEVSTAYANVMRNAAMVDAVTELIGPAVKFHHGKVNSKLPGAATKVKFHQDFTFQPMTNDDMITALLFVDDVTLENGPLEIVPGTHKGPLYSLWHDGVFTGAVDDQVLEDNKANIVKCTGKAGSACLMHCSLLHGSAPNLSDKSRTLYIATYYSEDAIELSPNALPSTLTHELVRGEPSGRVRCTSYEMEIPEVPKDTSFFAQQATEAS